MEQNLSGPALIKASIIAVLLAAVVFITIVMPAEFGQDPTGIGKKLGLTAIAEAEEKTVIQYADSNGQLREDTIDVTVPAGAGIEYKLFMDQFQKVEYEWLSAGDAIYFDLHGEPEGDTTGYFESYAIATLPEMKGSFTAPFTGTHGWYWKNTSTEDVEILLQLKGQYRLAKALPNQEDTP
ncbi:hypothetical protein [Pseudoteredinibacter isoporae]|uniref:Transmembrane anchor protein n=1 Tax=Pseudoteredinibacter isoporae TaxID=570281 RepID=A0A7X0JPT1_9GAMM|nr:hypothetical protein [Pseudoteredinibacter isoporae]MBB6519982.1 hypothetical protein [Pseudoteredinibacter isoporae]NHO85554.1 hypothetical protein [Pseudoteredinibacter isoporae]NIB25994.1 hypothetical protein [Pseudoteredinibacter isoporae]